MPMKFVTWNINSVRLRLPLVLQFLQEQQPDVLALQEIKCTNDQFPQKAFAEAGYNYQAVHGQKAYHGVAIISRLPLTEIETRTFCDIEQSRHISAKVDFGRGAIRLHNFYIPAGGDVPDVETNEKFRHKLDFFAELQSWFKHRDFEKAQLIAGDFNIAPHENDVWSHKQLLKVVSHTPIEIETLNNLQQQGQWVDLVRKHIPTDQRLYSWWSYRAKDWNSSDKGRRLDHIWSTGDVAEHSKNAEILREWRGQSEKPSDHAPVLVQIQ